MLTKYEFENIARLIFEAALAVHKELGPGLLESVYEHAMIIELRSRGLLCEYQVQLPLIYKGHDTGKLFIMDILVENAVVIEVKSCEKTLPLHESQLVSYLKMADKRLGFLINFNVELIKDGFRRKVNKYFLDSASIAS